MRPPICEICDQAFEIHHEGGLLYFKGSPEGIEFNRRVEEEAITGHPPNAGWFCGKHYNRAKNLVNLTLQEAISEIRDNPLRAVRQGDWHYEIFQNVSAANLKTCPECGNEYAGTIQQCPRCESTTNKRNP